MLATPKQITGAYTLLNGDYGKLLYTAVSAPATTITLPSSGFATGWRCEISNHHTVGALTLSAGLGATIIGSTSIAQDTGCKIWNGGSGVWYVQA
ncbi:MAG: hypothetical protein HC910_22405 [Spirulinaceae cyanobacterium SM2_1_0]|nr:hypothetical protein [Spirulinaceae cyanobacterium SM2_1_0]